MRRNTLIIAGIFVFFTLMVVLGAVFCPLLTSSTGEKVRVVIRKGVSAKSVVSELVDSGVVEHPKALMFWLKLTGMDRRIRPGIYQFQRNSPVVKVLWRLHGGPNVKSVLVTIPEGKTLRQIAGIVVGKLGVDSLRFVELAQDSDFIRKLAAKYGFEPPPSLEGYLFPDSYKFAYFEDEGVIIDRMVGRLMEVIREHGIDEEMRRKQLTLHEVLTLASIIEREAAVDSERPIISAVFWNRLKKNIPLESCATVEYALPHHKKRLTYDDLKVQSPYNTYIHAGLPPGPICSPGLKSIEAAVSPADVSYLYFVSKGDGTHLFARTYAEHIRNKRIARLLARRG